ncbi:MULTISPECIES: tetratricopeptide repeat protein [unclassified Rhizobacter]|uniref:tetratricopeptide repeat protein n=1 Tax=unclassified Rhizobacter TaxID=2640088 RepID=UPI0006FAE3D1|nr:MULTISPECIES: tetratricopeptide repeat protein [unclassified Rhizobacter]KQU69658.1 hypothetical protein ASC88_28440 [Rhizobacter sp. Root29]KQW10297.1 hypothetical protein ASC98_23165 [Rhizobacter sp. Root1238]KRB12510.1 hypothetical protein ASE08_28335 [Rhizobacter sp. Root16D2]
MGFFDWLRRPQRAIAAVKPERELVDHEAAGPSQRGVELLRSGQMLAASQQFREAVAREPGVASHHVNLAYTLQQVGEGVAALDHLRLAVSLDPESLDARYMLAGALETLPDFEGAVEHVRAALALRPDFEAARIDLCRMLALKGDLVQARAAIEEAMTLHPSNADFHHYLGNVCVTEGQPDAAVEHYRRALELRPDHVQVIANIGSTLRIKGLYEEAIASYEQALKLDPTFADAHAKWGMTRKAQGRLAESEEAFRRALQLDPKNPDTLNEMGMVLQEQGKLPQAIEHYRRAISLRPDLPGGYVNLGMALDHNGQSGEAVDVYKQGLAIKPSHELHGNLGITLAKLGNTDEAIDHYHEAIRLSPDNLSVHCNLASALGDTGATEQAIAAYRDVLAKRPDFLMPHSNLLVYLASTGHASTQEYLAEARRFDAKLARPPEDPPVRRNLASGQPLRVGFVSGDLRTHPVGLFIEGIIQHLEPSKLELIAYSTVGQEDALTARIKPRFGQWVQLRGLGDDAAARRIRADEVDILIDLAGHTAENRLAVFARRAAPVQLSWLGYWASTGVSEIDYVLADEGCVPIGDEHQFSERIWRLPQTRLCFTPPATDAAPPVAPLPALQRGHITFGCFQRLPKITDEVLALWGEVFARLPDARLLIQSVQTGRAKAVEQTLARLARVGIASDRVTLRGPVPRDVYLQAYSEVDIVLDTFPYTGGTTTCEALWMGVPTLTLSGDTMISRQGEALMRAAGLPQWVATDRADFVCKAALLASDMPALAAWREGVRGRLAGTALFDVRRFARNFEEAVAEIWRQGAAASAETRSS